MIRRLPAFLATTLLWLPAVIAEAQTTEFGGVNVIQNDSTNAATSVTLSKAAGSSPHFSIEGGNRGDYTLNFGTGADPAAGVMIPFVSELSRDNTAQGDTVGRFYATAAFGPNEGTGNFTIAVFSAPAGEEVNINTVFGFFPYNKWIGGIARNTVNNGELTQLLGTPGLELNTHFRDEASPAGVYTLDINSLTGNSAAQNGVLLVTGARNEDNYALSKANADGTFNIYCHDNGANGSDYENDGVGFVYLPLSKIGSEKLTAVGRVNGDASFDISATVPGKTTTVTKGATGIWYLKISNETASTGTLLVSPEGGVGNNVDNIVTAAWDEANSRWIIESRDLPGTVPGLQNASAATDDVFSFAFFKAPIQPLVTLTSPAPASTAMGRGSFTVEATASDADGSVSQVELLRNGAVIATFPAAPYSFTDANLPAGHYDYQARATDNEGNIATTPITQVIVTLDPASMPANAALSFDGINDYVTMGAAPELNVGQMSDAGFTLECWFRQEGPGITSGSGSGGVTAVPLFGKGRGESDGSNVDCNIFFGINAAGLLVADFEAHPATGISAGANYPITATHSPISHNVWHHAAVTYDHASSTWKMYLDGIEVGTLAVAANARPRYDSIQHFGIGTSMTSTGVPEGAFRGRIDEARVWNHARSATEIAAARDQPIGSATGLIARFGLNEGTGTTAASSVGSHVGTLTQGPLWVEGVPFGVPNLPPTVALTKPNGVGSTTPTTPFTFEATASDPDGVVVKVEFLVDGVKVGEDTAPPYSYTWSAPTVGNYVVTARSLDDRGATQQSEAATFYVLPTANHPAVVLKTPDNEATVTGSSTQLQANVYDPDGSPMTVTFYGRHTTPATPGPDFSIVQIPDTQFYSEGASGHADTISVQELIATFGEQTKWVVNNKASRNIAFVSHMGDIVQSGHNGGNNIEWQRASSAMSRLENPTTTLLAHGVPFGLAPGNHDIQPIGDYDGGSTAYFNQFFGTSRFAKRTYWGGNYGSDNTNNYQLFSISGLDFIALHFAYDTTPNPGILNWANALLKAHPHRRAIATSHSIIGRGNPASFSAQGRGIYDALKGNPNFFLMLCGHIHAEGRRSDVFEGRTVYSVLSDYQGAANGGNGFLRVLTFSPASNSIKLESYSPTLNRAVNASDSIPSWEASVQLPYNMQAPVMDWVPLGTVTVPAGGTLASLNWTGLEAGKNYEWYAAVSDGTLTNSSVPRRFITTANSTPSVSLTSPTPGEVFATPVDITLTATASDTDGSIKRVEFYQEGTKLGEDTSAPYSYTWGNVPKGSYKVAAVAVDNSDQATLSSIVSIVVQTGDEPPTVSLTAPTTGTALPAPASLTLRANATDVEAPVTKVEFYSDATKLGQDTQSPFTYDLINLPAGTYTFTARATDTRGQVVASDPVVVSVFVEGTAPLNGSALSVGTFDPPAWTVVKTGPAPRQFDLPGNNEGDLALTINGTSTPFNGGITLVTNWNSPATLAAAIESTDNISTTYASASGAAYVSVLDNSNNNGGSDNPTSSEQTSGVSVAYLPYADGWIGASVDENGTVLHGNLPAGVTVSQTATAGIYSINGLATSGNLYAVINGNGGATGDNVCSVRVEDGRWLVEVRDNDASTQSGTFSFAYIPPTTTGLYAAAISATGTVSKMNAPLSALGLTATPGAEGMDLLFGDGTVINPTTAALFVVADATQNNAALDNLVCWSGNGDKFRVFTQDLPQINGTHQAINVRILAIPYGSSTPVNLPTVSITAEDAIAGEAGADQALRFSISRTGSIEQPLTVSLTASGTATAGSDYTGFQTSVEIPASQASMALPLTVQTDALAEGDETVVIHLQPHESYSLGTPASATATITDRPDQDWYFSHITDPALRAPTDDADGDGLTNVLEYFMGTHPGQSGDAPEITWGENSAIFWFTQSLNHGDLTGHVEWSTDMIHWYRGGQNDGTRTINIEVTSTSLAGEDPQIMKGTATVPGGGIRPTKLFFRLSVTQ